MRLELEKDQEMSANASHISSLIPHPFPFPIPEL